MIALLLILGLIAVVTIGGAVAGVDSRDGSDWTVRGGSFAGG